MFLSSRNQQARSAIRKAVILLARPLQSTKGRRMKRKLLAFMLAGIMLCSLATPAFAKRRHKKHHRQHRHAVQHVQR
jgi:hypothetical protein